MIRQSYICCLVFLGLVGSSQTAVMAQNNPAQEIFNLVNQVRAANGLPPFQYDNTLASAAQNQASWMAQTEIYSHTQTNGSTPQSRARANGYTGYATENIVGGTNLSPQEGILWWQNSPIHNRTLLSSQYIHAGVGYGLSTNGQHMYVLVVGRPSDQLAGANTLSTVDDLAAPIYVTPIEISSPQKDGSITHIVQIGQTAWALAARYEISLSHLLYLNSLGSDPTLQPGDEIVIRLAKGQAPPPTPTPSRTHIVQEGQTLWTIAAIHNLSLPDLLWYNNLSADALLQPGDELIIRLAEGESPPPTPTPPLTHVVQAGESLWAVAAAHGLTVEELQALNSLTADSVLQPGDELFIRAQPTPTPSATPEVVLVETPDAPLPTAVIQPASFATSAPATQPDAPPPANEPLLLTEATTPTPLPVQAQSLGQTIADSAMVGGIILLVLAGIAALAVGRASAEGY